MSTLRQQMDQAMILRGLSPRTRESYLACVSGLARYYRRSPEQLDQAEIQAYLLHLISERHLAYASVNQASCAFRFLFAKVLGNPKLALEIPMAKAPKRLPSVLSRGELARLFAATTSLRNRTLLVTAYAAGLRVSELCALQVADIESAPDRMCLKVRQGKGSVDRYTLLSARLLELLRTYWCAYRPQPWLFPGRGNAGPIDAKVAQRVYGCARDAAGLPREGGIHTLRHCFATHLLEAGVDLHCIQRLLGHGHVTTTTRYLHLAQRQLTGTASPYELIDPLLLPLLTHS